MNYIEAGGPYGLETHAISAIRSFKRGNSKGIADAAGKSEGCTAMPNSTLFELTNQSHKTISKQPEGREKSKAIVRSKVVKEI